MAGLDAHRDGEGFELVGAVDEVRAMDERTIDGGLLPGRVLMELAGAGSARLVRERAGGLAGRAVILCGGGHNGGDGFVVARHLRDAGWSVRVLSTADPAKQKGDVLANRELWEETGGEVEHVREELPDDLGEALGGADVVVDALFGTGLSRPVEGRPRELIERADACATGLRVAVDLPSGIDADRGTVLGVAFRADVTPTFGMTKLGLLQHPGAGYAGEVQPVNIAIPRPVVDGVGPSWRRVDEEAVAGLLPERPDAGHKGTFGHVAVVGGFEGKEGAAVLAGRAALRGGTGLLTWCRPGGASSAVARPPELMSHDLAAGPEPRSDVMVAGPGLGVDDEARRALDAALDAGRPLVLDADALNLLAERDRWGVPEGSVLTPHPGEAGRLLGLSARELQADRPGAARRLAELAGAPIVLKGAGTLIAPPEGPGYVVPIAEPTLGQGGTGDVLSGLVAALLAQGLPARDAAVAGAWLHGRAAEELGADRGRAGVLASELADHVPGVLNALRRGWLA